MACQITVIYVDGRDHENLYAANGSDSMATTRLAFCGICLSTNTSFSSLFSTKSTAKINIS